MKYISFVLIASWSFWAIYAYADLKPSENYLLWLLCAFSFMYTAICIISFLYKTKKP